MKSLVSESYHFSVDISKILSNVLYKTYYLALQQIEPRIFDNVSEISLRMSQLSSQSRPEALSESELASQPSQNNDSGIINQRNSQMARQRKSRSQASAKIRRPWEVYLSSKPLKPHRSET